MAMVLAFALALQYLKAEEVQCTEGHAKGHVSEWEASDVSARSNDRDWRPHYPALLLPQRLLLTSEPCPSLVTV